MTPDTRDAFFCPRCHVLGIEGELCAYEIEAGEHGPAPPGDDELRDTKPGNGVWTGMNGETSSGN